MEQRPVYLVLIDISGYTQFIQNHRRSLLHAEAIITKLMGRMLDSARHPLILNKLEGDAAFFYAPAPATPEAAADILAQVRRFFGAFYGLLAKMSACDCCRCDACGTMRKLELKAVVHFGEVVIKRVRRFTELAGSEVILAHRLLKNSVPARQYILLTEAFHETLGASESLPVEARKENVEGMGKVLLHVHYPEVSVASIPANFNPAMGILQFLSLRWYELTRRLGRRGGSFTHLPG